MDKKTTYIIIAIVIVAVIGIIILMSGKPEVAVDNPAGGDEPTKPIVKDPVKTETQTAREIGGQRITIEDNNTTYSLTPGAKLVMMLGADYKWTFTSSDENVLAKREIPVKDSRIQAVYQVAKSGKAVLSATGTCIAKTGCTAPAPFSLKVEGVISDDVPAEELMKDGSGNVSPTK